MLPGLNLPVSLLSLLNVLRPCFTAPGFATFCGLVAGLAGQVRRRTVVGMLLGGALQHLWPHERVHYFFARARPRHGHPGLGAHRRAWPAHRPHRRAGGPARCRDRGPVARRAPPAGRR